MINLLGLGAASLQQEIDGFLESAGAAPSSGKVAEFLNLYPASQRAEIARALVARGVSLTTINAASDFLDTSGKLKSSSIYGLLTVASSAVSGYHGYRRNDSIPWALWWALMGGLFPIITPVIGYAQGWGQRK